MQSDRPSPLPRWVKVSFWTGLALFLGWLGWVQLIKDETVRAQEGFLARTETVVFQPEENGLEVVRELESIRKIPSLINPISNRTKRRRQVSTAVKVLLRRQAIFLAA